MSIFQPDTAPALPSLDDLEHFECGATGDAFCGTEAEHTGDLLEEVSCCVCMDLAEVMFDHGVCPRTGHPCNCDEENR